MKTTIEILTEMAAEEQTHVETLPAGSKAALRFVGRRDALFAAIAAVDAANGVYDAMDDCGARCWGVKGIAAMNKLAFVVEAKVRSRVP